MFDPMPPPYPLGWTPNVTFVQPDAEQALRDKLAGYKNADVYLSTTGVALAQDEVSVSLKARGETGDEFEISARYLVGCDGANSFVREHLVSGLKISRSTNGGWWWIRSRAIPARDPPKAINIAGRRAPERSCPDPEIYGDGRSSCCRAKIRKPPARPTTC
jgi:3-(3-hydroxy-phenyl)propionate hydroxylase